MEQSEIDLAGKTDSVLEAAFNLFVQTNKGPVRGMRAFQIDKKERVAFAVELKKLVDDLGSKFEAVYPRTSKVFSESIVSMTK